MTTQSKEIHAMRHRITAFTARVDSRLLEDAFGFAALLVILLGGLHLPAFL